MENFNPKNYRKDLAEDLKTIRKVDPEAAQKVLENEQEARGYNVARAQTILDRKESLESGVLSMELSPEIRKLLLEGKAEIYTLETRHKSIEGYKKELTDKNIKISDNAKKIIEKIVPSRVDENHYCIRVRGDSLPGIGGSREEGEISHFEDVQKFGLDLCEPKDALAFCLINKEWTTIATSPIDGMVFSTGKRDESLVLEAMDFEPTNMYPRIKYLFRLHQKPKRD